MEKKSDYELIEELVVQEGASAFFGQLKKEWELDFLQQKQQKSLMKYMKLTRNVTYRDVFNHLRYTNYSFSKNIDTMFGLIWQARFELRKAQEEQKLKKNKKDNEDPFEIMIKKIISQNNMTGTNNWMHKKLLRIFLGKSLHALSSYISDEYAFSKTSASKRVVRDKKEEIKEELIATKQKTSKKKKYDSSNNHWDL